MKKFTIELDAYQVANLREALEAAKYDDSPLCVLDRDWLREVLDVLPETNCDPNCGARTFAMRAKMWGTSREEPRP